MYIIMYIIHHMYITHVNYPRTLPIHVHYTHYTCTLYIIQGDPNQTTHMQHRNISRTIYPIWLKFLHNLEKGST